MTEGYTPKIVRIVHECFRDDVLRDNFDVPTYTSAAVLTHDNLIFPAAVSRLNISPPKRAQQGASLPMAAMAANWTEILDELEEAESADAKKVEMAEDVEFGDGDDLPDFDAVDAADDDNVEPVGVEVAAIWTAEHFIETAQFVVDQESKISLLGTIESKEGYGARSTNG